MNQFISQIRRLRVLIFLLSLMFVVLLLRAGYLVTLKRDFLLEESHKRVHQVQTLRSQRGAIVDRNNEPLAVTTTTYTLSFDPARTNWSNDELSSIESVIGLKREKILQLMGSQKRYQVLAHGISVQDRIALSDISNLEFKPVHRRFYSLGDAGASLVGFVDHAGRGIVGIEQFYNQDLLATDGKIEFDVDAAGNVVGQKHLTMAGSDGQTIALSIDKMLQSELYFLLKDSIKTYEAESGVILVSEVESGDILAMVNYPSFNPNEPITEHNAITQNRAVQTRFEPGSTIKPIWLAWLLSKNYIDADVKVKTSPGVLKLEGGVVKDVHDNGTLTLTGVLQKSSNVAMAKLLMDIEPDVIEEMMNDMSFSHHHAIGLPGEVTGSENIHARKSLFAKVSLAFGYGIAITPELIRAYSMIAAGGVDRPLKILVNQENSPSQILKKDSAIAVSKMMHEVVNNGTGWRAKVKGIEVAGKTGTSHRLVDGQYDKSHRASFVGFAPLHNPRYVVLVILDAPKGKYHFGGTSAAPLFAKAMDRVISYEKRKLNTQEFGR